MMHLSLASQEPIYFKIPACLLINESKLPPFVVNLQVLRQDVLTSDSGELTEVGRSYIPPRVLLDALSIICSAASQWGDLVEAESLAMETLIVTHHPSIGRRTDESSASQLLPLLNLTSDSVSTSRSSSGPLACPAPHHEHEG